MKHKLLLLAFSAALFTGCSTYKAGQTPDDVYYSPARELTAERETTKNTEKADRYDEYVSSQDDRYLRMKIQNRNRWSVIDDYGYWNDSRYDHCYCSYSNNDFGYGNYGYGYNRYRFNPYRTNYFGYGGSYSPYYPIVYYRSPKVYTGNTGKANLTTYQNNRYNNRNYSNSSFKGTGNQNTSFGNLLKTVFSSSNNNNNNSSSTQSTSWDRPVRTIDAGTTTSSSAGGKSGGYNSSGSSSSSSRPPR